MNNLDEVARNARALMEAHGVGRLEFAFDSGKRRMGAMHSMRIGGQTIPQRITLSKHYASMLTSEEIRQVMLHEIAHALTPGDGHGRAWKAKARELGYTGERCAKTTVAPKGSWTAVCPKCGEDGGSQHRAPLRVYMCGKASCKHLPYPERILVWSKDGYEVSIYDMPVRWQNEHRHIVDKYTV